jgi:sec-independent protein translocase protein TatA
MFGLGSSEIIILAVIFVLFFGTKKIPELAKGIGEAFRYIRDGFSDEGKSDNNKDKTS